MWLPYNLWSLLQSVKMWCCSGYHNVFTYCQVQWFVQLAFLKWSYTFYYLLQFLQHLLQHCKYNDIYPLQSYCSVIPIFLVPLLVFFCLPRSTCLSVSVCLLAYLPVCLLVCLPIYLSVCLLIFLSTYLSVCQSTCLSTCLSVSVSACLSTYLPIYLSVCLPVCLPAYLPVYLPVCLSACLPAYLCVCVCVCLFWCCLLVTWQPSNGHQYIGPLATVR